MFVFSRAEANVDFVVVVFCCVCDFLFNNKYVGCCFLFCVGVFVVLCCVVFRFMFFLPRRTTFFWFSWGHDVDSVVWGQSQMGVCPFTLPLNEDD